MRVGVIGAGPAGITAAYQLAKGGATVEVFETDAAAGGLSRTIPLWGQHVDLGPHRFFSADPRVNQLWEEVTGDDYRLVDRLTRIYYKRRLFHYPLKPFDALRKMGVFEAGRCVGSYLAEKLNPTSRADEEQTFESWVVSRFGRRLFEMFFKSYSEKLWGISCQELDADFAAQRIKGFSLAEALKSSLGLARRRHKTLVDRFAYPIGGTGMVYQRMADFVDRQGGRVHLNSPVRRILHEPSYREHRLAAGHVIEQDHRVTGVELADGQQRRFDHVISTMPLTLMVEGLGNLPADVQSACQALTYRNTILVYLKIDGVDLFPDQWLYLHAPELTAGRITNFRNWTPELYGNANTSILALEFWCNDQDSLWNQPQSQLIDRASREIRATGLIGAARILDGHVVRLHRCYPVYRQGYKVPLARITEFLDRFSGLSFIGRYGAFKYNNQDHSILMGILAAENILQDKRHDLTAVNTDYDTYQESAETMRGKQAE